MPGAGGRAWYWHRVVPLLADAVAVDLPAEDPRAGLAAYADAIGDMQTATLARQIQAEEEMAAKTVWPMIRQMATVPAVLNEDGERSDSYPYTGP